MCLQIEKLDDVAESLEELWISYNQVTTLDGLSNLSHLTRLYMSNNSVKSWSELDKLVSEVNRYNVKLEYVCASYVAAVRRKESLPFYADSIAPIRRANNAIIVDSHLTKTNNSPFINPS